MTRREERLAAQALLTERFREGRMGMSMKPKGSPVTGLKRWVYKLVWPGGYTQEKETPWAIKQRSTRKRARAMALASRKTNQRRAALARRARQKRHARCA